MVSDSEAIERVRAGEICLYELLMRRYNRRLFRVIRSVISDDGEAEDVVQDAWVRGFEHLEQFENRSSFATWITKIAFYEALSRVRKGKKLVALENAENRRSKVDDPEKLAMQGELKDLLRLAVDRLPPTYRCVFMMREVEQLSSRLHGVMAA